MAKRRWSGKARLSVKRYNAYRRAHTARINALRAKGIEPYYNAKTGEDGSIPLTYREYKEIYAEEKNDRLKEIEKGKRKSIGNINSKIISDQVYELSERQAYSIFDYMKTLPDEERAKLNINFRNINSAIMKIREGIFVSKDLSLWDKIKIRREELFAKLGEGKKKEIAQIVSNEFFYPEEDESEEEIEE